MKFSPVPRPNKIAHWQCNALKSRHSFKCKKNVFFPKQLGGGDTSGKKYWCYYPHWSRDLVSPVCRIFLKRISFFKEGEGRGVDK